MDAKRSRFLTELLQIPHAAEVAGSLKTEEECPVSTEVPSSALAWLLAVFVKTGTSAKKSLLLIAPDARFQDQLANDLEAWEVPFLFYPEIDETLKEEEPDPDLQAERISVLRKLEGNPCQVVLATQSGLEQQVPDPASLRESFAILAKGKSPKLEELAARLVEAGYEREHQVMQRGQFSVRGGLLDCFSWHAEIPVRLEWFGDELDSLREFDPAEQRSLRELERVELLLGRPEEETRATLAGFLSPDPLRLRLGSEDPDAVLADEFLGHAFLQSASLDQVLQENRKRLLREHLLQWSREDWKVVISCNNEGERERLDEWLADLGLKPEEYGIERTLSPLLKGFLWPRGKLVLLTDAEIFDRYQTLRKLRKREGVMAERRRSEAIDFSDLQDGDYVVHYEHGVAIYAGLQTLPGETEGKSDQQVLCLQFADQAKLYVPLEQAYLVSKYVGVGKRHPPLDVLGGSRWERTKIQAQKAIMDYASQLLKLHAERAVEPGFAFPGDNTWQHEFEEAFLYEETTDQLKAIEESKRDMENSRPMDRLICGDVGFGKTEVAIRTAFKAVMGGRQVAFLAPTTVLAEQHGQTLRERMADYPVRVEVLSRFRSKAKQNEVITALCAGEVDIVVGTHRLISNDVKFKNLGLVIIDEEQRFGVKHKDKLKTKFRQVDVLTLSATPIPRTLYMALVGARDMSTIETPPRNRLPVETTVTTYDDRLIRSVIERELNRGGQVYYLHNRVQTIYSIADHLKLLLPKARIDIGHGQMDSHELEDVMHRMVAGQTDILVATTIIESGVDIPNANTIIIDRADRFGLADLYQLRGRVGRSQNRAYALLLLPRDMVGGDAGKRVRAIRQYSALGSGYKIAMRDLEIRGAGNILGTAQSGHVTSVGFDLYCRLLKKAIAVLKGEESALQREVSLSFDFLTTRFEEAFDGKEAAYIPASYMSETKWRIAAFRELAELQTGDQWMDLRKKWKDVYGRWPEPVELLLAYHKVRVGALECPGVSRVEVKDGKLQITRNGDFVMVGARFPRLTASGAKPRLLEVHKWLHSLAKS